MSQITPDWRREAVETMARAMWERDKHGPQITWDEFLSMPINVHRTAMASFARAKAAAALDALLALGWRAPVAESESENPIVAAIEGRWGERCPDYDEGCCICQAWAQYDEMKYAQDEHLEQSRLLGMGAERELALMAERDRIKRDRDMWATQCERQAAALTQYRAALVRIASMSEPTPEQLREAVEAIAALPCAGCGSAPSVTSGWAECETSGCPFDGVTIRLTAWEAIHRTMAPIAGSPSP